MVLLNECVAKKNTMVAAVLNQALEGCTHLSDKHNANLNLSLSGQLEPASIESCRCDKSIYVRQMHSEVFCARLLSALVDCVRKLLLADGGGGVDVVQAFLG